MIRLSIVVVGTVGTSLTYLDSRTLAFWILSSDLTYTVMLPQLICILFVGSSNAYGAVAGYVVAFVMRVLCGEPAFPWLLSGGWCLCAALAFQDHLHAVLSGHHPGIFLCDIALVQQGDPPREVGPVQGEDSRRNSTSRWRQTR